MPTSKPEHITSRDLDSLVDALRPTALPLLVRSIDKHGHSFWGTGGHAQVVVTLQQYFSQHYKKELAKTSPFHMAHMIDVSFYVGMYLGSVLTTLHAQGHKPLARKRGKDAMEQWEAAVSAKKTRGKRQLQFETVEVKNRG